MGRKTRSPKPRPLSPNQIPLLLLPFPSTGERGTWKEINFDPWILGLGPKLGWKAEVSRTLLPPLFFPRLPPPFKLPRRRRRSSSRRDWRSGEGGRLGAEGRAVGAGPVPPPASTPGRKRLSREPPPKETELGRADARAVAGGSASPGDQDRARGRAAGSRGRGLGSLGRGLRRLSPWDPGDTLGSFLPGAGGAAMLLSGGDPPAQEWVMVQTKSKPRVQRQRLQVQRIFRIKLNAFQSRPDNPYFWLQLEGPRENMGKAKVNSFSLPPPIPSYQTPLPFPCLPGRQRSPEVPDLDSPVWPAGTGPSSCLSTSAVSVPSLWFLLLLLFLFHFCSTSLLLVISAPQVP